MTTATLTVPDGHTLLNSSFSAACHPLICTIGDDVLPALRPLCRGSRVAADAGRKRLQVSLPTGSSEHCLPQPQDLHCLLARLPALAHVTIAQDHAPDLQPPPPSAPNTSARHTVVHPRAAAPHGSCTAITGPSQAGAAQPPPARPPPACLPWRTALCTLRPQHLRSLELDGLVVTLPTHGSLACAEQRAANGAASATSMGQQARGGRPTGQESTLDLLTRLLLGAPGLQELALLRVTVRHEEAAVAAAPAAGAALASGAGQQQRQSALCAVRPSQEICDDVGGSDGDGGGAGAGAVWCAVLRALPPGLTSLRLGLSRPPLPAPELLAARNATATSPPPPPPALLAATAAAAECGCRGLGCGDGRQRQAPCPTCLGTALRRLPRLACLELSGVAADVALAALRVGVGALDVSPNLDPAEPQQRQQRQCQQRPQPSLELLERLLLDVEGHLDLGTLREEVLAAPRLPRLRHIVVVEQRAPPQAPAPAPAAVPAATAAGGGAGGGGGGGSPVTAPQGGLQGGGSSPGLGLGPGPSRAASAAAVEGEAAAAEGEASTEDEAAAEAFCPLGSVLWMLRRPGLRRLSFTSDRSFTTLERPQPGAVGAGSGGGGGRWSVGGGGGGGGAADWQLSSVRLSMDLSAEALQPLVAALPPSLTSLTLNVGTLHRPSDVLAAYAVTAAVHRRCGGGGGGAAAAPPPVAAAALDSPAWLSVPPQSFLGGLHFLWPALTALPAVAPRLRELRLGGGAAAGCSDHVLRCWAGASGHPDSLATPMVVDPSFNAMVRHQSQHGRVRHHVTAVDEQQHPRSRQRGVSLLAGGGGGDEGGAGDRREAAAGAAAAAGTPVTAAGGAGGGGEGEAAAAAAAGAGAGFGWSDWARSLERVCLMAQGPTVAGALHLRRFMRGLRRLQVVVDGRLTDVAVVAAVGGPEGVAASGRR